MDARFYNSEDIDIERLASDLVSAYLAQGYKVQQIGSRDQIMVQLKKGGDFEAIIGMQAALSLTLQRTTGGVLAMIGQQRWIDKAAIGAVGIALLPVLWPLAVTAGAGALRQASMGNQVLNMVDGLVRQQRPGISVGPIPQQLLPQVNQQWGPPPPQTPLYVPAAPVVNALPAPAMPPQPLPMPVGSSQSRCTHCNTPYEPGDTFCTGCGRSLIAAKLYCSNCNSELKPGIAFCPKCGSSTFNTVSASQQMPARPGQAPLPSSYTSPAPAPTPTYVPPAETPVYTPPVQPPATPVYTPPPASAPTPVYRPATPVYTPPAQPTPPPTPVYTPPATATPANPPAPQVYYVPSQAANDTPSVTQPKQPEEPYYVPPVTQEPAVKPQPKVTIVTSTPKEVPPPPKAQPQKQYYIPSHQEAQAALDAANAPTIEATVGQPASANAPTIEASTVNAPTVSDAARASRQASQPSTTDSTDPWGSLTFSDDQQVQLSGERAVVGRYDHDLGGMQPEVDLAKMQGADTVSRIHAALEHVGSAYTLTDLNSTNSTRINGKRLEPDKAAPINDGDTLQFGKITCTFRKS